MAGKYEDFTASDDLNNEENSEHIHYNNLEDIKNKIMEFKIELQEIACKECEDDEDYIHADVTDENKINESLNQNNIDNTNKNLPSIYESDLTVCKNNSRLNNAIKISEQDLKLLDRIKNNLYLANQRKSEIYKLGIENYIDDIKYRNHVISVHNDCINYAMQLGIQFWKSYDNTNIYYRINKFTKKYKLDRDEELYSLLDVNVKIYNSLSQVQLIDNTLILISDYLTKVKDEIFYPYLDDEWLFLNNIQYKNTFQYSDFLRKRIISREKQQLEHQLQSQNNSYYNPIFPPSPVPSSISPSLIIENIPRLSIRNELKIKNPDSYRELQYLNQQLETKSSIIKYFIKYFSKDDYQFNYIMNWLANFFQNLSKSAMALVLIGDKETTNIFINNIIRPIFAYKKEYFSIINDDTLKKTSETIIKDKIFYHVDELSMENIDNKKISRIIMNLIKPNPSDINQSSENSFEYIYGETIVTSSCESPYPFLKDSYSRCSVFSVKHMDTILKKFNLDRLAFEEDIQDDLDNFSNILASYVLDKYYFNIAETEEKNILSDMKKGIFLTRELDNKINEFVEMIKRKNLYYFNNIKLDNELYTELEHNFNEDMIAQPLLGKYFDMIQDDIIFTNENTYFIEILKTKSPMFNKIPSDKSKYNNKKRYEIPLC